MNLFIEKKAQEISFALLRVAAYIRRFELRRRIENLSYHLIENISYKNDDLTLQTIEGLISFITLAKNVYELEPVNYDILKRELTILKNEIEEYSGKFAVNDIEKFFTRVESIKVNTNKEEKYGNSNTAKEYGKEVAELSSNNAPVIQPTNRQQIIIDRLRTSGEGKLQLKDILEVLPEVSERTIRYDLKKLFRSGKIFREGSGPSSYYMLATKSGVDVINN
ncbi:MAG: hypothetical protein COU06_01670 [Candidatus Harrisonbacteria bacterium CG10_big_fil_rev_8_21_14_0_10_38_8]|uniref:HTH deoR-type domain-containing protein n=1 Tax=Candidatus Harrisonbacteria bacterium CG10_big_fil_rev_8_21_14_0_10_38_8 TaxID=1974582 RepID=A0A2M6WJX9_9BACT|nr:MAG: hypothetical protein COU06_01670 [Candidatus Harrisonbacteria bacterium CG10_big_fil_rev_8_21_14_0_10_38_8]